MLIKKILLENYGLYNGRVEFDLAPRIKNKKSRPIVLFGGNNGAGKTTLLNAIRLTFYGKSILGDRVSKTEYEDFLRGQIHRAKNSLLSHKYARVGAEFEHVHLGKVENYYVERSWTITSNDNIKEFLHITQNNETIDNVSDEYWRGIMEEIIPERLSQLFFFDGEKIKAIAEDKTGNRALADAIKLLLGLDIVDRLKADLSIYNSKEIKKISSANDVKALSDIEANISKMEREINETNEAIGAVNTEIKGYESELKKSELHLDQEGVAFSDQRNNKKKEKEVLTNKISDAGKQIIEECERTFPFALCPTISSNLKKQIKIEEEIRQKTYSSKDLNLFYTKLLEALPPNNEPYITEIKDIIDNTFSDHEKSTGLPEHFNIIHDLSKSEEQRIFEWLNDAAGRSLSKVKENSTKLNNLSNQLHNVVKNLSKTPDEDLLKPIFEKLNIYNRELGIRLQKRKQLEKELSQKHYQIEYFKRDKTRLEENYNSEEQTKGRLQMVKDIQSALDSYLLKLTKKKIAELRNQVADCFNHLSRKGDLISHIDIDSKSFQVTLIDHKGKSIPKKQLSAGEKQIFSISMLWGLAKTAKRQLPVIIDTPLGRLDSEHRSNLINNYFPEAGHQVILFSTDTEVDNKLYRELSPNISHCYQLAYDKENRHTTAKEGYFWKESSNA